MPLFGGIDGGGSKTLAVLVDETGQEIGRSRVNDANYQVLMTQGYSSRDAAALVAQRLVEALTKALPDQKERPLGVFTGLAGVDRPQDTAVLRRALDETQFCPTERWEVVNDAELILYGLRQNWGIGLIAGTGSIAVGRNQLGKKIRAGGWGYIFGDEGSGYQIGRAALQAAAQAADKRGPSTELLPRILAEWKLHRPESLISVVYSNSEGRNQKIAQLASLVFALAQTGDEVATKLAENAIVDLASTVWAIYNQLDFEAQKAQSNPALGLGGGLLLNTATLKTGVVNQLKTWGYQPEQIAEVEDPAKAAALACLRHFREKERI